MLEYLNCPICKNKVYLWINACKITSEDADIPEKIFDMLRCRSCGLIFINPLPKFNKENLKKLYDREYFNKEYMKFYSINQEKISCQSNEPFSWRLNLIEKYKSKGRILDIGCASGRFLNLARESGWEVFGVELSDYVADFAIKNYHLNVFCGFLEEAKFKDNYFDVVCASDIIEHLNDPESFLGEIYRILNKEGLLYLASPNASSFYYKFFGLIARYNRRNYFVLPHHIYHFSPLSIKLLLNKTGFNILKFRLSHSRTSNFFMNIFNFNDRMIIIAKKKP